MKIEILEIAGLYPALAALHLPMNRERKAKRIGTILHHSLEEPVEGGEIYQSSERIWVPNRDVELMKKLVLAGDEHAKVLRGIVVWYEITAPIYWWYDLETYRMGHERLCSESTMHGECKNLYGEELQRVKGEIPLSHMHKKVDYFSYQCLRTTYRQRKNHRLPEFKEFCQAIEKLPFADNLITVGLK